jgi:hypothetical protein
MNKEDIQYHRIENYLHKKLGAEDRAAFENDLALNPKLKEKVLAHQLADDLLIEFNLEKVKSVLASERTKATRRSVYKKILIAAGIGMLVVTGLIILNRNKTVEKKTSPLQKIKHFHPPVIQKSGSSVTMPGTPEKKHHTQGRSMAMDTLIPAFRLISPSETVHAPDALLNADAAQTIKTERAPTSKIITEPADPCKHSSITAHQLIQPACKGENQGSVTLTGIRGGSAPYSFTVFDAHSAEVDATALPGGTYMAVITDKNGCTQTIPGIIISEKDCISDFSFNPFTGETWSIIASPLDGKLIIYDHAGNTYFEQEIIAGGQEQWSGHSRTGELKTGYFLFVIYYKDGSEKHGSVTIVQ